MQRGFWIRLIGGLALSVGMLGACSGGDTGLGEPIGSSGGADDSTPDDDGGPDDGPDDDGPDDDGPDDDGPDDDTDPDGDSGGCDGCVDQTGECRPGIADDACGVQGDACMACMGGSECAEGECLAPPACNADNCDGCCDGDTCVDSPNSSACGAGGLQCTACPDGAECQDGACELPCAETCDGCCTESDKCISADEQSADGCGMAAEACVVCGDGLDCLGGACISATCANTCGGCCVGDACIDATDDDECGSDGQACIACPGGSTCDSGQCVPDPMALWNLTLIDGEVSLTDADGDPWDSFNGLPDPYVTADLIGSPIESMFIDDTIFPVWDELVAEGVTTVQLMDDLEVSVVDSDFGFDTTMATCIMSITPDLFGTIFTTDCSVGDFDAWTLSWSLMPN